MSPRARYTFLSMMTLYAACGDGRGAGQSACDTLRACCDTLPSGSATTCAAVAMNAEEASCTSSFNAIKAAGSCTAIATGPGPDGGTVGTSDPCGRYLSCLLQATPQAYGAAIQLYGKDSACWTTPQQTAGCNQACEASFKSISKWCECTGDSCQLCKNSSGSYYTDFSEHFVRASCADGSSVHSWDQAKIEIGEDRITTVRLSWDGGSFGMETLVLAGLQTCAGTSNVMVSVTPPSSGCELAFKATLTPSGDGKSINFSMTETRTCTGSAPSTCTYSGSMTSF